MNVYVYQAALICECCADNVKGRLCDSQDTGDSDDYPRGPYANGGGEADTPQHCDICMGFLRNPLTREGQEYVKHQMTAGETADYMLGEYKEEYYFLFDDE